MVKLTQLKSSAFEIFLQVTETSKKCDFRICLHHT